jgi:FAD/FMN-containing dehydrogenase
LWRAAAQASPQAVRLQQAEVAQLAWQQWPSVMQQWHRQVQHAFDPHGVFDTGRLWPRHTGLT